MKMPLPGGVRRGLPAMCFLAFLAVGLALSGDYGVHLDERNNQSFGDQWGRFVARAAATGRVGATRVAPVGGERGAMPDFDYCHGPFWEMALHFGRELLSLDDPRGVLLFRHRANFLLFFCASLLFYLICARVFKDWRWGLLGWLMLILHPRIFAEAFYNTVDLAFLSFFIAGAYTLFRLLEKRDVPGALWHALTCAWLTDTRAAGLILPVVTLGLLALEGLRAEAANERRRVWRLGGVFTAAFVPAMIFFWPLLWRDTTANFIVSVRGGTFSGVAGMEREFGSGPLYNAYWIGLTTPPVFLLFFLVGAIALAAPLLWDARRAYARTREPLIALLLGLIPLGASVLAGTTLYNGWRHHYFVYPFFVIVGVFGFTRALEWSNKRARAVIVACALAGILATARFIAANHPFQFSYANIFARWAGGETRDAVMKDYWAVSHRQALEFVLASDSRRPLRLSSSHFDDGYFEAIFPQETRELLHWVSPRERADYRISGYSRHPETGLPNNDLVHLIEVDGVPITAVYR